MCFSTISLMSAYDSNMFCKNLTASFFILIFVSAYCLAKILFVRRVFKSAEFKEAVFVWNKRSASPYALKCSQKACEGNVLELFTLSLLL